MLFLIRALMLSVWPVNGERTWRPPVTLKAFDSPGLDHDSETHTPGSLIDAARGLAGGGIGRPLWGGWARRSRFDGPRPGESVLRCLQEDEGAHDPLVRPDLHLAGC